MTISSSIAINLGLVFISIVAIVLLTSKFKLNAFASLFIVSFFLAAFTIQDPSLIEVMKKGFGDTMGAIAFIIIFGAIIAVGLERSGGARSIANAFYARTGQERAPLAMALTGYIPGLTIFCDTGFIILSGIARSFSARSKVAMPMIASILACSLYSVHCLVPTHPGALAATGTMKIDVGYAILMGVVFSIPGTIAAYYWSIWMCKGAGYAPAMEEAVEESTTNLPSFGEALLPVVLPLILIAISSVLAACGFKSQNAAIVAIHFLGNPVIALLLGAIAAVYLLSRTTQNWDLNHLIDDAIGKAGPILIITAAGGMFGAVIKQTGVAPELGKLLGGANIGLLVPFIIAVLLKTAQGSSTIAMLTSAAIIEPLLQYFGLDSANGRMLAFLAMGAGSMTVSHANDSFFWVITKFSNIDPNENLRVYSTATIIMAAVTMLVIWLASLMML